jgi:hypothetical protein
MSEQGSADGEYARLDPGNGRILAKLLTEPFPGRDEVARQIAVARGRTIDAEGSLALSAVEVPRASVVRRIPVEAEVEDVDGVTIHVLLHVVDGYIDESEIYRDDGAAVQAPIRDALRVVVL